ncbi:MAG: LysE family transporter [Anaerolineales bacterium]|nr:LysE family transporter [Anaerolineales bacterium]
MSVDFFLKGLVIGFSIAAPVGVIGVLCIRRTLLEGRLNGFVSGLGAATADAFYGALAGFGLTIVSDFLIGQQFLIRLAGGVFLLALGVKTFFGRPKALDEQVRVEKQSLVWAYASTLLLTLTNPLTILSFVAIFAGLGLGAGSDTIASALSMVVGVFSGSALWWLFLSGFVGVFRKRLGPTALVWINRLSGAVITAFGCAALYAVLLQVWA